MILKGTRGCIISGMFKQSLAKLHYIFAKLHNINLVKSFKMLTLLKLSPSPDSHVLLMLS